MSNPITELQGGGPWQDSIVTPLPEQQAPPAPTTAPNIGVTPEGLPPTTLDMNPPPPPELQGGGPFAEVPVSQYSALNSPAVPDTLGGPVLGSTMTPTAPKITGNQEAFGIAAPRVLDAVMGGRQQAQEMYNSALDPTALPVQRAWERPDLEGSITRFGYNSAVLADSYKRQVEQRQDVGEKDWLNRNMAAIEAMSKPSTSATANSMDWVTTMLGLSQDGVRQYVGAATFDKTKNEWVGSPIGGVLYALGILQNSSIGALYDVANTFYNMDKGLRQAYESFTPPWARGSTDSALKTLGLISPLLRISNVGGGPGLNLGGKYNDGKSNFLEALRGAQYSFSDKAGNGLGLDFGIGFEISTNINDYKGRYFGLFGGPSPFKPTPGGFMIQPSGGSIKDLKFATSNTERASITVNPGVLVGVALDVVTGAKVDSLAGKFLKGLFGGTKARVDLPTVESPPVSPTAPSSAGIPFSPGMAIPRRPGSAVPPAATTQPASVFKQLDIPYLSGPVPTNEVPKTPRDKPQRTRPSKDVQQILPIKEMMQEFGDADRLLRPDAYKSGIRPNSSGQLSLRLDPIERTPLPPLNPLAKNKKPSNTGKQLKLEFDVLPEAVLPKPLPGVRKSIERIPSPEAVNSLDDLTPEVRGKVLNVMERKTLAALEEVKSRMEGSPDIGRRYSAMPDFIDVEYTPFLPQSMVKSAKLPYDSVPFYHGTRVRNLDIPAIDPTKGAALSELGTGVYISSDAKIATLAAESAPSQGLPNVPGREWYSSAPAPGGLPRGAVYELKISPDATIIDATKPLQGLDLVVMTVAAAFPGLKGVNFKGKNLLDVLSTAAIEETSVASRLKFQQKLTEALRSEGIDGVKAGNNYSIYNPQVLEETGRKQVLGVGGDLDAARINRSKLEQWGLEETGSPIAEANALDTSAEALSNQLVTFELQKTLAAEKVFEKIKRAGSMDQPNRVPTLKEYAASVVDDMFGDDPSPPASYVKAVPAEKVMELYARGVSIIEAKGVKVVEQTLEGGVGGFFRPYDPGSGKPPAVDLTDGQTPYFDYVPPTQAEIGMPFGAATSGDFDKLKSLIHEITHAEIEDFAPYTAGEGVTLNESIADAVGNSVLSILFPAQASRLRSNFQDFFEYIPSPTSGYALQYGATEVGNHSALMKIGELATVIVKETVEKLSPGFRSPALTELRIFGAGDYSGWAISYFKNAETLKQAFDSSLVTLADGLSKATKLGKMATNPVSGKLNTDVLEFFRTRFADELSTVDNVAPPKILREWATEVNNAFFNSRQTKKVADTIVRILDEGGTDYNRYLGILETLDAKKTKKFGASAKSEVNAFLSNAESSKPKLIREWAEKVAEGGGSEMFAVANIERYMALSDTSESAIKVLDDLNAGGIDYDSYFERLRAYDVEEYKKYVEPSKVEIDDYLQRIYCGR